MMTSCLSCFLRWRPRPTATRCVLHQTPCTGEEWGAYVRSGVLVREGEGEGGRRGRGEKTEGGGPGDERVPPTAALPMCAEEVILFCSSFRRRLFGHAAAALGKKWAPPIIPSFPSILGDAQRVRYVQGRDLNSFACAYLNCINSSFVYAKKQV